MIPVQIVVAMDERRGIGKGGELPWKLSGDLKHFREVTCATRSPKRKNVVVMGRVTWESIPKHFRPLHDRINVVMTRDPNYFLPEGVLRAAGFDQVLKMIKNERLKNIIETIFVVGGQKVYEETIRCPECVKLYITRVHGKFDCDTFFPPFEAGFEKIVSLNNHNEGPIIYHFEEYVRKADGKP
jgi:dihydrofolate reductase